MKRVSFLTILLLVLSSFSITANCAEKCTIIDVKERPGTGPLRDYELILGMGELPPGAPFFFGEKEKGEEWIYRPITPMGNGSYKAVILGWRAGDNMKFNYGRGSYWITPACFKFEDYFVIKLGEPYKPNMVPIISLLNKSPKIISFREVSVNNSKGNYEIVFSLKGVPSGVPFINGPSYYNSPWKQWFASDNGNGTATALVNNWSRGVLFQFDCGTISGGKTFYINPSGSPFAYGGHFGIQLGEAQACSINNTADNLVLRVENHGGSTFRLYLNFPAEYGYKSLFLFGQQYLGGPWIYWPVTDNYPCSYVDIYWPYYDSFHFVYGVVQDDGTRRYAISTTSSFLCEDHLCVNPHYPY